MNRHVRISIASILLSASLASAATGGKLTVEPPTLSCAGFHWQITGDGDGDASATVEFRKQGDDAWRKGIDFMRIDFEDLDFVAGSLIDLDPATTYEARITLVDPDGVDGEASRTVPFTTRGEPTFPAGGKTWHIYPDGHDGATQTPLLAVDNDWRKVIADARSRVMPGDTILAHAGTYTVELSEGESVPTDKLARAAKPTMPEGGTVWHVYPPKHKGEKQQPLLGYKSHRKGYWAYDFMRNRTGQLKPGDTILVHAGVYKVRKNDYRDPIFQAPRWGSWRVWYGGEPGKPVLVKAAGDGPAIFDGDDNYLLMEMIGSKNVWFDGLTFRNVRCAIMAGQEPYGSCAGLTVTNCTFEDVDIPLYCDTRDIEGLHLSGNKGLEKIHTGPMEDVFGTWRFRLKGTEQRPIVLKAAGDGEVVFDGGNHYAVFDVVQGANLWFHGITIRNSEAAILAGYCPFASTTGLIVTRCKIVDVRNGIYDDEAKGDSRNYYIADNYLLGRGRRLSMNDHTSPFGIYVSGKGHVVRHNHVEWFQDCIDTGWDRFDDIAAGDYTCSMDISNNVILQGTDDFIEMDNGMFNIRALRNLCLNTGAQALSMQGAPGGPFYWVRNIACRKGSNPFKLPRNMHAFHNVFTSSNAGMNWNDKLDYRNNLFLPYPQQYKKRNWGKEKLVHFRGLGPGIVSDYNAYRRLPDVHAAEPFSVDRPEIAAATLAEYAQKTGGLEAHSLLIDGFDIFRDVPEVDTETLYKPGDLDFRLKPSAPVVDAGCVLPNVNDTYRGKAPDLGAIELGDDAPQYGPREPR